MRELEDIVKAAEAGDESAWTTLVGRFHAHLARVARSYGLNAAAADDVAQETWVRLFRHIGHVRDPRALAGWLSTTARRESLVALRSARREEPTDVDFLADLVNDARAKNGAGGGRTERDEVERRTAVREALGTLPERHRAVMEALLQEPALSYAQISAQLGVPVGSIGPIRRRCVERLRRDIALSGAEAA